MNSLKREIFDFIVNENSNKNMAKKFTEKFIPGCHYYKDIIKFINKNCNLSFNVEGTILYEDFKNVINYFKRYKIMEIE